MNNPGRHFTAQAQHFHGFLLQPILGGYWQITQADGSWGSAETLEEAKKIVLAIKAEAEDLD